MTVEFSSDMGVELVEAWGTDRKVAMAARTSTRGLDNDLPKIQGLVRALWRDGHFSPFEHCGLTIGLDVPMFVRDQWVRHKSMSFSVMSARYRGMNPKFYVPTRMRPIIQKGKRMDYRRDLGTDGQHTAVEEQHRQSALQAWAAYQDMVDRGVALETARAVLPTSIYTQMWVSGTLRSWLHFLDARVHDTAQWEIRQAAREVEKIIRDCFPITHHAWAGS